MHQKKESSLLWDTIEKEGKKSFFGMWALGEFPSSLAWTKEETVLLSGKRPRTILGFWMRKKSKRRESSFDFSLPSNILLWSIFDIEKIWDDRRRRSSLIYHQKPTAWASTPVEGWSVRGASCGPSAEVECLCDCERSERTFRSTFSIIEFDYPHPGIGFGILEVID